MPKEKLRLTRKQSKQRYEGGPCDLLKTEPSTYQQIIQYYYHLSIVGVGLNL